MNGEENVLPYWGIRAKPCKREKTEDADRGQRERDREDVREIENE